MLNLFKKKEPNRAKIIDFWIWFKQGNQRIIDSVENETNSETEKLLWKAILERALTFITKDGYRGKMEFEYIKKDSNWILNLHHKNNVFLERVCCMMIEEFNNDHFPKWKIESVE